MILGAQTYTIRELAQTEQDIRNSFQKIAQIGYTTVQISGIGPVDPHTLRDICDENGLKIVLTHTPEARLLHDTQAVIREHEVLGCRYIGLGSMPERYRAAGFAGFEGFVKDFLAPAKKMRDAGKLFMYHNHHFEFQRMADGHLVMDAMLERFPADLMGITLDTYWLQAAGCDVCQWIEKLNGRIPCIHLKDMAVVDGEVRMAPVGEGNLNFSAILDALKGFGATEYLLVEQDTCYESPFICLKKSYDCLTRMGYR